jgi:hypothetical protein
MARPFRAAGQGGVALVLVAAPGGVAPNAVSRAESRAPKGVFKDAGLPTGCGARLQLVALSNATRF